MDVGPDQHKALQHAERKVRTYGKALLGLAGLLGASVRARVRARVGARARVGVRARAGARAWVRVSSGDLHHG